MLAPAVTEMTESDKSDNDFNPAEQNLTFDTIIFVSKFKLLQLNKLEE